MSSPDQILSAQHTAPATENTDETLAEAAGLTAGYGGRPAIEEVSFRIARGQRIGLLGPNGGGKTTLLRAMLGELAPMRGSLRVATRCGVVPQTERSRLDYPVSALDVALMGSLSHLPWWRRPGRSERRAALDALDAVGLRELAGDTFGELSGGQRQRVLVARGLVQEAGLLLLDEPFSGLDSDSAERLEQLIAELAAGGRGVIVATHDLEQARRFDLVLCLNRRQIAFGEPDRVLDLEVLEATYRGAIVEVPGEPGRGILPPHHHDHHDHD
ncbi:MAG TPA: metal ABC transporter ATP-binding protein [Solirubrobacterales bacterium]|jgi:ABC-type Mn2+/Zn2+ transport system ATPase subunit